MTIPSRPADTGHYTRNSDHKWIFLLTRLNSSENWSLGNKFISSARTAAFQGESDLADELIEIAADLTEADLFNV